MKYKIKWCLLRGSLLIIGVAFHPAGFALEIIVHDSGPSVKQGVSLKKVEPVYPRATPEDVLCGKAHHMSRFRLNENHAGMPFSITARKMTRVTVRWDHEDKVLFPYAATRKTIVFPHAGGASQLYLRAYQPIVGNVYIMDDQGVVIRTCPYSFLPAKHYRQSVSVNVNETAYERINNSLSDKNNNVSINYRISSKSAVPEGEYWSFTAGFSQSESSRDSRRVNGSFSYNW